MQLERLRIANATHFDLQALLVTAEHTSMAELCVLSVTHRLGSCVAATYGCGYCEAVLPYDDAWYPGEYAVVGLVAGYDPVAADVPCVYGNADVLWPP